MDESSPFNILGIPQWVIDEALKNESDHQLLKVAESQFRNLSRLYHPDMGGDGDKFIELVDAYAEIKEGPLEVARYYSSHRQVEARWRRNQLAHAREFSAEEKKSVCRLLYGVNPLRVAPWLKSNETLMGNLAFDSGTGKPLLVSLTVLDSKLLAGVAAIDYDGRKFIYSRSLHTWRVSVADIAGGRNETFEPSRTERINVVGGMDEDEAIQLSSSLDTPSDAIALSAAAESASLSWTPASTCGWLSKIKPTADKDDYLVVINVGVEAKDPLLSVIGPVYRTHPL